MGISGLLPFLKKASRRAHLQDFKGQTAAVDAYCWLHKGAFSCADKLVKGEPTNGYVVYMMKQINLLLTHGIKPIMVFDGCHLPSKAVTETKRRENRERNRKQAKELLRQGRTREAQEHFQRCVEVTSEMAHEVIHACREKNIDVIVAPYEADAQLAYLNLSGLAQLVITEDSDLLVFGCKATLFKMDSNGGCVFVDQEKLHLALNIPRDKFSFEKFRNITILSGCDYLPSLPGIGLAKSCKFFNVTANTDIYNVLCRVPSYLNMPNLEVTQEYREKFMQAINTFLYQLVFDPVSQTLRPLNQYPDNMGPEDFPYAGKFVGHERALQIALGNVNVRTGEIVDTFDPNTFKTPAVKSSSWDSPNSIPSKHQSIWSKSPIKRKIETPSLLNPGRPSTSGKEVTVTVPLLKKKVEMVPQEDDLTEECLQNMYSQPHKRQKIDASPERLGETSARDCKSKSPGEGNHDKDSTVFCPKEAEKDNDNDLVSTTPPETDRVRNPFAKQIISPKKYAVSNNQFSAIRKFSRMRKTVIDSSTVVQSRYFSSSVLISSGTSEAVLHSEPNKLQNQDVDGSPTKYCEIKTEESKQPANSSRSKSLTSLSPTSYPVMINSKTPKTNIFQWKQFSYQSYSNKEIKKSSAASDTFKTVTPKSNCEPIQDEHPETIKDELILSVGDTVNQEKKMMEEVSTSSLPSSQASSLYSDAASIDNESFDLTPSLPTTLESSEVTPLRDATNCLLEPHNSIPSQDDPQGSLLMNKNKCRTPGLSRTNNKRKEIGKKQLSLTEMFKFKREGRKPH